VDRPGVVIDGNQGVQAAPMVSPDQSLVLRLARNKDQGHGDRGHHIRHHHD
jgi:hypothetical protein